MSTVTGPARTAGPPAALARTLVVVVIGSIMAVLDVTIVNVALHPLATVFDAPLATVQWVATGYTLALCAVIPVAAWAMGRFGAKRTYLTALALFTGGSAVAALSSGIETLVLFRVVQGLGGGLLVPVGMAMVIRAADREHMGRAMAVLGVPVLIGPVSGPILGGWLIDTASWHWIFLVNLPVGAVALVLAARLLPSDETRPARRLDVPGLLMLSPGLALLIYGLTAGGAHGDFTLQGALPPIVAGLLLIAGFVARGLTTRHPLLQLRLFRDRTFAAGIATMVLFPAGYFGSMLLTPMYYQTTRGLTATESGLLGVPLAVAVGTSMQIATRRIDRVSPRLMVVSGIVVAALGLSLFGLQLGPGTPYWRLCAAMLVMGAGVGMVMMPVNTTATRTLAPDDVPSGSTTINIVSQIGTSIGTALMSVVLASHMADAASQRQQAAAFQHTYWWAVTLLALASVPALFLPRRRRSPGPSTAAPVTATAVRTR
ncbi:DHA2 family efflux MFS transporter permease subunit [Microbispora bryophytorum]|uniref:Multidrug resistance protein B n=1 Tax=Microbispora bryophytorum TaxID=1460882 RepID=A0A8H9L9X9_9ACTN|nr:DHA2 family efflux MFS transporter permease subunit [Microbispora bryophytorum]MBD3139021.1 DHA2 family efflux MFS transporter permease subunit [Microbispora bryophytorum]TQS03100.1 DHA2 family efflux MFS transporter permease subunit [Microbispora bryophytorum]GGO09703.1 multidrug resistance protein B [Microbispora bryophytorum]